MPLIGRRAMPVTLIGCAASTVVRSRVAHDLQSAAQAPAIDPRGGHEALEPRERQVSHRKPQRGLGRLVGLDEPILEPEAQRLERREAQHLALRRRAQNRVGHPHAEVLVVEIRVHVGGEIECAEIREPRIERFPTVSVRRAPTP